MRSAMASGVYLSPEDSLLMLTDGILEAGRDHGWESKVIPKLLAESGGMSKQSFDSGNARAGTTDIARRPGSSSTAKGLPSSSRSSNRSMIPSIEACCISSPGRESGHTSSGIVGMDELAGRILDGGAVRAATPDDLEDVPRRFPPALAGERRILLRLSHVFIKSSDNDSLSPSSPERARGVDG
jgi:hypothetical protein